MLWNSMERLVREDDGMEMIEWSIVGVVFALAGALIWAGLSGNIQTALTAIGNCVSSSAACPGGGTGTGTGTGS